MNYSAIDLIISVEFLLSKAINFFLKDENFLCTLKNIRPSRLSNSLLKRKCNTSFRDLSFPRIQFSSVNCTRNALKSVKHVQSAIVAGELIKFRGTICFPHGRNNVFPRNHSYHVKWSCSRNFRCVLSHLCDSAKSIECEFQLCVCV